METTTLINEQEDELINCSTGLHVLTAEGSVPEDRLDDLRVDIARLQRLVRELLVKNQQLRFTLRRIGFQ